MGIVVMGSHCTPHTPLCYEINAEISTTTENNHVLGTSGKTQCTEAKEWLKRRKCWKITRNKQGWDHQTIEDGDIFELKDGVQQERKVRCTSPG
jgi:hypothetical protein